MDPSTAALIASGAFQTGKVLHSLGGKYLPGIKRVINHVFSTKSRQTAKDYVSNLRTAKGLQKAITKDLPSVVKKGANLVTSGKALKAVTNVAGDILEKLPVLSLVD
jgi:hypothetical protein